MMFSNKPYKMFDLHACYFYNVIWWYSEDLPFAEGTSTKAYTGRRDFKQDYLRVTCETLRIFVNWHKFIFGKFIEKRSGIINRLCD